MNKYHVSVSAVKRALASGLFGSLTWQSVCARPVLARHILKTFGVSCPACNGVAEPGAILCNNHKRGI